MRYVIQTNFHAIRYRIYQKKWFVILLSYVRFPVFEHVGFEEVLTRFFPTTQRIYFCTITYSTNIFETEKQKWFFLYSTLSNSEKCFMLMSLLWQTNSICTAHTIMNKTIYCSDYIRKNYQIIFFPFPAFL
jgi:hypothetical protein